MPLKLEPPRKGHPNYQIRGTYLGKRVDRSSGSPREAVARKALKKIEGEIERGEFAEVDEPTFGHAAANYLRDGGDDRFLKPLLKHFGETPLSKITQTAIDKAAVELYPLATNATRNRQVHARVSTILKRAGIMTPIQRPIDGNGKPRTQWLWPNQADRFLKVAAEHDAEFAGLCILLLYTGMRLSEALGMMCEQVHLSEATAYCPTTKNGDPRTVFLPPVAIAALSSHPRGLDRPTRVFRFTKGQRLYQRLEACCKAARIKLDPRTGFHVFRHTWGTWMRRYGKVDVAGLVATGVWKDKKSAARYAHVVTSEEAKRAALLPVSRMVGEE